jgi:type II secretory pathway component PulF
MMGDSPAIHPARPLLGLITLLGLSAIHVFMFLIVVPKFERIYQEALPGMPLPGLTGFVIGGRFVLALIALVWLVAGVVAAWQRSRAATWIIRLGYVYFFPMIGVTVLALFMPFCGVSVTGMSNEPLNSAVSSR